MTRFVFVLVVTASFSMVATSAPIRVALMDFEDGTGMKSDAALGGGIAPGALADKGLYLLGEQLLDQEGFSLIDRRDFMGQIEKLQPKDREEKSPTQPSFIQAAQTLRADVVLRGILLSFSPGKEIVDQGGYKTEFSTLSLRLSIEALDVVDGSIVAIVDGAARSNFRQTTSHHTILSEDDAIGLMEKAIGSATPKLIRALQNKTSKLESRPKIKLSIKTSADPALVEIDGVLIGTSPLQNLEIYQGDHVLTIGKPGYRDLSKRILFEANTEIEVPMIRTELSADEMKEILEKARLNVLSVQGDVLQPGLIIKTVE